MGVWRQALGLLLILAQAAVVAGAFGRMAPAPKSHSLRDFFCQGRQEQPVLSGGNFGSNEPPPDHRGGDCCFGGV